MGPVGPCRSPDGLVRSLPVELLQRSAPLSTLHRHIYIQTLIHTRATQRCIYMPHMHTETLNSKIHTNTELKGSTIHTYLYFY